MALLVYVVCLSIELEDHYKKRIPINLFVVLLTENPNHCGMGFNEPWLDVNE